MAYHDNIIPGEYRDDENPLRLSNALIAGEPDDVEFMGCIANCNNRQGIDKRACEELCRTERLEREQRIDFEVAELLADVEEEMEEGAGAPLRKVTGSEARRRAALRHNADVFQYLQPASNLTAEERRRLGALRRRWEAIQGGSRRRTRRRRGKRRRTRKRRVRRRRTRRRRRGGRRRRRRTRRR